MVGLYPAIRSSREREEEDNDPAEYVRDGEKRGTILPVVLVGDGDSSGSFLIPLFFASTPVAEDNLFPAWDRK